MTNAYYAPTGTPGNKAFGSSAAIRAEFAKIAEAFDKLPDLLTLAGKLLVVNALGTAIVGATSIEDMPIGQTTPNTGAFTTLAVGGSEAIRIKHNAGFVAGYNTANTIRTGTLQFNAGADVQLTADAAATTGLSLRTSGGTLRLTQLGGLALAVAGSTPWAQFGGANAANSYMTFLRGGTAAAVGFIGTDGGAIDSAGTGLNFGIRAEASLLLMAGGATAVTISSVGDVGFGGTPNAYGAGVRALTINATSIPLLDFNVSGVRKATIDYNESVGGLIVGTIANQSLLFYQNGIERGRFNTSGNFVVGAATSPFANSGRGVIHVTGSTSSLLGLEVAGGATGYVYNDGTNISFVNQSVTGALQFGSNSLTRMQITAAGLIQDANGFELGWKSLPIDTPANNTGLVATQRSKMIVGAFGNLNLVSGQFARGDMVTIYQDSGSSMTLIPIGGFTLRLAGTETTGTRTIAARGICTLLFNSSSEAMAGGPGVT